MSRSTLKPPYGVHRIPVPESAEELCRLFTLLDRLPEGYTATFDGSGTSTAGVETDAATLIADLEIFFASRAGKLA